MHVHLPKEPVYDERKRLIQQFGYAAFIGILLLLNVTGTFTTVAGIDTAAILALIAGYRTFFTAVSGLLQRKISADLAICVAVIAALASGQYLAAAEAMFIMLIGEALEGYAAGRTHAAIQRFVEQLPRHARVLRNGVEIEIDAAELVSGDIVLVRPGERIPADGVIVHGASSIDESTITGEPLPRDKSAGDEVFSGTSERPRSAAAYGHPRGRRNHAGAGHQAGGTRARKAGAGGTAGGPVCSLFSARAAAGRGTDVLFHARLAAYGGGIDRRLPVCADPGYAGGHGSRDWRTGAARHPGARRRGAAKRRQG